MEVASRSALVDPTLYKKDKWGKVLVQETKTKTAAQSPNKSKRKPSGSIESATTNCWPSLCFRTIDTELGDPVRSSE